MYESETEVKHRIIEFKFLQVCSVYVSHVWGFCGGFLMQGNAVYPLLAAAAFGLAELWIIEHSVEVMLMRMTLAEAPGVL